MTVARVLIAALVAMAAAPAGAAAAAPRVEVMVAGRASVLAAPRFVRASATTVAVGRRRCGIAAATPLAALAAVRRGHGPAFRLRDYGACSRRAVDSSALFVTQVGPDRNRRADGWVYKVGRRVPSVGAADPSGRRLRTGDRLTWFYCRAQSGGGCQRTLEVAPLSGAGQALRVRVRGYDDNGRGVAVAGATVSAGAQTAVTGADGTASFPALGVATRSVEAQRAGMVPSFPVRVASA
ncbi:MAG: hypothetical protein QOJ55_776 [Solirubrobacteraceae bacterium]|nr:hypothetical protein [Solirubrobacteraceae bacterium]